jgi:S1-C subfamily serine protease
MHDGFAGGAFLDATGGLIGVVTARAIRGLGVIIPGSIAWSAAASVIEHGRTRRGYLGVAGQSVSLPEHQRGGIGRKRGMLIVVVTPGSPASNAGMLVGDVLLALDGTPFESPEELLDQLMMTVAGRSARLQVLRGSTLIELNVSLGERPAS